MKKQTPALLCPLAHPSQLISRPLPIPPDISSMIPAPGSCSRILPSLQNKTKCFMTSWSIRPLYLYKDTCVCGGVFWRHTLKTSFTYLSLPTFCPWFNSTFAHAQAVSWNFVLNKPILQNQVFFYSTKSCIDMSEQEQDQLYTVE